MSIIEITPMLGKMCDYKITGRVNYNIRCLRDTRRVEQYCNIEGRFITEYDRFG